MKVALPECCPDCGRERDGEPACPLCGHLFLQRKGARPPVRRDERAHTVARIESDDDPDGAPLGQAWVFLAIGALTAPLFAVTPLLQYMGWFLGSLTHELGHAATAWFFGMPAVPAIRLDGHAAAFHREQSLFLVLAIAGLLAYGAWNVLSGRARVPGTAGAALVYLAVALTPAREGLFLVAGHGGELLFAGLCLWRTMTGGFTASFLERVLYGTVGCYLLGDNLLLTGGLVLSEGAREAYAGNGSFGLTNDYLRLARSLRAPLPLVAAAATLAALGLGAFVLLMVHVRARATR